MYDQTKKKSKLILKPIVSSPLVVESKRLLVVGGWAVVVGRTDVAGPSANQKGRIPYLNKYQMPFELEKLLMICMDFISNAHVNSSKYYELISKEIYNAVLILC